MTKVATAKAKGNDERRRAFRRMLAAIARWHRVSPHQRAWRHTTSADARGLAESLEALLGHVPNHSVAGLLAVAAGELKLRARLPAGWDALAAEERLRALENWRDNRDPRELVFISRRLGMAESLSLIAGDSGDETLQLVARMAGPSSLRGPASPGIRILATGTIVDAGDDSQPELARWTKAWVDAKKSLRAVARRHGLRSDSAPRSWDQASQILQDEILAVFRGDRTGVAITIRLLQWDRLFKRAWRFDEPRALTCAINTALKKHRANTAEADLVLQESLEAAAAAVLRAVGFETKEATNHVRAARQNRERRADARQN